MYEKKDPSPHALRFLTLPLGLWGNWKEITGIVIITQLYKIQKTVKSLDWLIELDNLGPKIDYFLRK